MILFGQSYGGIVARVPVLTIRLLYYDFIVLECLKFGLI